MVLVLFLLVGMTSVFAQKHVSVSGRITDELNEPMIGVSVLEKGTTNGVITDLDGNYTLSVNEGATIVFSYIGCRVRQPVCKLFLHLRLLVRIPPFVSVDIAVMPAQILCM